MNAPANIRSPAPIRLDETAAERAYRQAISIHCPNGSELEMAARVDMAIMRDQAAAGIPRASDSAGVLLAEVSRLATLAVYAPAPTSDLLRLRSALQLTMMAARALERVTRG